MQHPTTTALLQPTKRGEVFVLDRMTGEPILPVEERPVPQDGAPSSERLSKTQPYSVAMPSFRGPDLTERSMWGLTPLDQLWCRIRFRQARYEGPFTPLAVPCQQPPYGFLSGVDLATGQVIWHRPLGTAQDSGPLGVRLGLKIPLGPPSSGGAITTAGGLTFVAASLDAYLRAFDIGSGRQMVVIAAGGMKAFNMKTGDYVVAFALPRDDR